MYNRNAIISIVNIYIFHINYQHYNLKHRVTIYLVSKIFLIPSKTLYYSIIL